METQTTETPKSNPLTIKFPDLKPTLDKLGILDGSFSDVPADHHAYAVMGEPGDTKIIWDKRNSDEVDAARATYKSLTKKGYRAFHVTGKDGLQGDQMDEFDPNAERVIFIPQMQGG